MNYKTIAVHVNESRHCAERIRLAATVAIKYDAHLIGVVTTSVSPVLYMSALGDGAGELLASHITYMNELARTKIATFEDIADRAGVLKIEGRIMEEEAGVSLCMQGRYSDLLVIGQSDPEEILASETLNVPEYVITHSPCPVLVIPFAGQFDTVGKRIVIAWNGSTEASHAVTAALPFLEQAETAEIAVFNPDRDPLLHGEQPGADLALRLARHGVNVEVSERTTGHETDIGDALLSHLADFDADLLVMGGYGHTRLREVLLGGVTRTMLKSMTIPVLMEH